MVVSPGRWIHTVFAKSPIDVAFVGADGTILRTRRALKPGRAAAVRGSHAVIEGRAGFITRAGLAVGDRVALREAQAPRPAREVAPWRSALDEDGDSPPRGGPAASGTPTPRLIRGTSARWMHLRHRRPHLSQVRGAKSGARGGSGARGQSTPAPGSFPRRLARATARPPDADRVVRSRRDHGRDLRGAAPGCTGSGKGSSRGRRDRDHSRGGDRPARRRPAGCAFATARPVASCAERRRAGPARAAQAPGVAGAVALAGVRDDAGVLDEARALRAPRPSQPDTRGVRAVPAAAASGCGKPSCESARARAGTAAGGVVAQAGRSGSRRRGAGRPAGRPPRRPGCGTRRRHRRRGPSTVAGPWRARCPRRERR